MEKMDEIHETNKAGWERKSPARLDMLLDMPPVSKEVQVEHGWNPQDKSPVFMVNHEDSDLTCFRLPVAHNTDCIRGKTGFSKGLHVWEIEWPSQERGSHAVVGVATEKAPLSAFGYLNLVGSNSMSWGWDIVRGGLYHDSATPETIYPKHLVTEEKLEVPDTLKVVLDMDEGTLAFMAHGMYLGVAFSGLKGKKLFPIVSAVWGYCQIKMTYIGGLDLAPLPLTFLCKRVVRQSIGKERIHRVDELCIPRCVQNYVAGDHNTIWYYS